MKSQDRILGAIDELLALFEADEGNQQARTLELAAQIDVLSPNDWGGEKASEIKRNTFKYFTRKRRFDAEGKRLLSAIKSDLCQLRSWIVGVKPAMEAKATGRAKEI